MINTSSACRKAPVMSQLKTAAHCQRDSMLQIISFMQSSSAQKMKFFIKDFLMKKFTGKHLCQRLFKIKLQASGLSS